MLLIDRWGLLFVESCKILAFLIQYFPVSTPYEKNDCREFPQDFHNFTHLVRNLFLAFKFSFTTTTDPNLYGEIESDTFVLDIHHK